jgi:inositol phosphorylceramide mannosyltransferase catalytic subunit
MKYKKNKMLCVIILIFLILLILMLFKKIIKREKFTNKKNMAVLIHTFDGYSRYWKPLLYFINKYLNIDYDIYIGVENKDISIYILGKVKILKSGTGSFVDRLQVHTKNLENMGYKYIYIMQEDHWYLNNKSFGINNREIFNEAIKFMDKDNIDCLKLYNKNAYFNTYKPYPSKLLNKRLYYINKNQLPISHNGCIIKIELLKHLYNIAKNKGWNTAKGHEMAGLSTQFDNIKNKLNWKIVQCGKGKERILDYEHVGIKGNLNNEGINALKKENISMLKEMNKEQNQIKNRQEELFENKKFKQNSFPKILHHIFWDFTDKNRKIDEIPEFYVCQNSWLKYHPDWKNYLWDKPDMDKFIKKHFPQYFTEWYNLNKKIKKVDMFRYMVLYKMGGLYSDLDLECFMNYDNLIEKNKKYEIILYCHGTEKKEICNNGIMISKPNNKFWIKMIEYGLEHKDKHVLSATGPPVLGKLAFKNYKKYNIKLLDNYYDKILQRNGDASKFCCYIEDNKLKQEKEKKYIEWKKKGYHIGNFHCTPKNIHWSNIKD